ncbi:hypothetical protein [Janthinobacterium aquaticum]|uniref:hypothetical protein n=1 Tax=Janthinobacterium sp. FT58W TaxID=2654254 RepID=UPI0012647589|nr:hypothetical protein [Janthinobacterium sp. FT58W]KAB8038143.1 hypothetical protein GCM43_22690 [Janthinobacterium sp. FT58W]
MASTVSYFIWGIAQRIAQPQEAGKRTRQRRRRAPPALLKSNLKYNTFTRSHGTLHFAGKAARLCSMLIKSMLSGDALQPMRAMTVQMSET